MRAAEVPAFLQSQAAEPEATAAAESRRVTVGRRASSVGNGHRGSQIRPAHRRASGVEFSSGDFRKPQLSATMTAPLSNRQRRRPSGVREVVLDDGSDGLPFVLSSEVPVPSSAQARDAARPPTVVQRLKATGAWTREMQGANSEDEQPLASLGRPLDLRLGLVAALGLCLAALLLPASGQPGAGALWTVVYAPAAVAWPTGLTVATLTLMAAMIGGCIAWMRGALRIPEQGEASVGRSVLGTATIALVSLWLREVADPSLLPAAMSPMRTSTLGLPDALWTAMVAAGLLHTATWPGQRISRMFAGLGAAGLIVGYWMPVGWVGSAQLPLFAAFKAMGNDPAQLAQGFVSGPLMASPWLVVAGAVLPLGVLAALAAPRVVPPWALQALAGLSLLLAAAAPLAAGQGASAAALGASLQVLGIGVLLVVLLMGLLLDLGEVVHHDVRNALEALCVVALIGTFLLLKLNGMRYSATDEGIYYYAARAWAEGVWPYHDFFFSHPPLHIAIPAMLFAMFGFSFGLAKALSAAAALVAGLAAWRMVRKHIDPLAGVLALGLYLMAGEVLKASTNLTGINLTAMWMMLGLWLVLNRKDFLSGLLFGAAVCTGVYAFGAFAAVAALLAFAPRPLTGPRAGLAARIVSRPVVQFALGFVIVAGTINALGWLLAGEDYIGGVYRYHFLKATKVEGFVPLSAGPHALPANVLTMLGSRDFIVSLYYHAAHYWLALLAPLGVLAAVAMRRAHALARKRREIIGRALREEKQGPTGLMDDSRWMMLVHPRMWWIHLQSGGFVMISWVVTLALIAEFAQFKERYDFYYALILPPLAMVAAGWIHALVRVLWTSVGCGWSWRPEQGTSPGGRVVVAPRWVLGVAAAGVALSLLWVPLNMWANRQAYPSEYRTSAEAKGPGERLDFEWIDAPGPAIFSSLTRHALWQGYRLRGSVESGVHHYLWSKKRWFSSAPEIAAYIQANSDRSETITGSSTHAPIVALLADRRMAADHVDTNSKTFKTGAVTRESFWDRVCKDNIKFIVAGPRSFFSPSRMASKPTVAKHFRRVMVFEDTKLKHWQPVHLELWQRHHPPGQHRPCTWESGLPVRQPAAEAPDPQSKPPDRRPRGKRKRR